MIGGMTVRLEYEKPTIEVIQFYSCIPLADEVEPGGPSGIDEGFEKWPED